MAVRQDPVVLEPPEGLLTQDLEWRYLDETAQPSNEGSDVRRESRQDPIDRQLAIGRNDRQFSIFGVDVQDQTAVHAALMHEWQQAIRLDVDATGVVDITAKELAQPGREVLFVADA